MAKVHGRLSNFDWNAVAVNGIMDQSLNLERPSISVTTHDSGDFEESIQGRMNGNIDLSLKWDEADPGQGAIQADLFTGTERPVVFQMETGTGLHEFTGTGQVTSWVPSGPNDDASEVTANIQLSGTIVEATQP